MGQNVFIFLKSSESVISSFPYKFNQIKPRHGYQFYGAAVVFDAFQCVFQILMKRMSYKIDDYYAVYFAENNLPHYFTGRVYVYYIRRRA